MQKSKQNDITYSTSFLQDKWLVFKDLKFQTNPSKIAKLMNQNASKLDIS